MTANYKPEGSYIVTPENKEYTATLGGLEYAYASGLILEGRAVKCTGDHDLIVELGKFRGVIPRFEAAYSPNGDPIRDIAVITRVGKAVCFKITGIDKSSPEPRLILSRREAQEECHENYISHLRPGDIIDARVTHEEPFGAFCDIGCGMISLLSVDGISVSRILHPKDRFFVGEYIKAVVKDSADEMGRITLSHKELLGTWEENTAAFSPGETAAGIIRSIEPYGIFVELTPNLAGLAEWREDVEEGQSAAVYIKSIIPEKMKVKLVIVDSYNAERRLELPEYRISSGHIDRWRYSPEVCPKVIETVFSEDA